MPLLAPFPSVQQCTECNRRNHLSRVDCFKCGETLPARSQQEEIPEGGDDDDEAAALFGFDDEDDGRGAAGGVAVGGAGGEGDGAGGAGAISDEENAASDEGASAAPPAARGASQPVILPHPLLPHYFPAGILAALRRHGMCTPLGAGYNVMQQMIMVADSSGPSLSD
jgi:hypothetical protein